jgi:dTDP-4-dehydrorhamnose reductase
VLVLGGRGQIASAVAAAAPEQHEVVLRARDEVDIGDPAAIERAVRESQAAWIVNGAAYTAVDLAEDEPAKAAAINDVAVGVLAAAANRSGARLLHLSTDFVFDGASSRAYLPDDAPRPLGVYGASKLAGERRVLESGGSGIVLRTAWVYASRGRNFVLTMLRLMREKDRLAVVCDQIGAPTWAAGIAAAIWGMIDADVPGGIHHWTDLGVASWYDFAVAIQEEALTRGLLERAVPIAPIATADYPTRARRPGFSVLDTAATRARVPAPARHWRQNLRMMLDELRAR